MSEIQRQRRRMKRKRCLACELLAEHHRRYPLEHEGLVRGLSEVPMDDRAPVIVQWIDHLNRARALYVKGLAMDQALALSEVPVRYLMLGCCFGGDSDASPMA